MLLIAQGIRARREIREKAFREARDKAFVESYAKAFSESYVKAFAEAYPKGIAIGRAKYDQRVKEALERFGYEVNGCPTLTFTPEVRRFLAGEDDADGESVRRRAARKWRILGRK